MVPVPEIDATELRRDKNKYTLVDVREPHELSGPEGQIEGATLAPMGSALAHFLRSADPDQSYVFICRSGHRSVQACAIAHAYGFRKIYNLKGGMLAWCSGVQKS